MILPDRKIVIITPPATGSTSVEAYLEARGERLVAIRSWMRHYPHSLLMEYYPEAWGWETYHLYRDPYERAISLVKKRILSHRFPTVTSVDDINTHLESGLLWEPTSLNDSNHNRSVSYYRMGANHAIPMDVTNGSALPGFFEGVVMPKENESPYKFPKEKLTTKAVEAIRHNWSRDFL